MDRHQIEDGAVEEIEHQMRQVVEEYKSLERKCSNVEVFIILYYMIVMDDIYDNCCKF